MEIKINEEQSVIIDERDEKSKSKANTSRNSKSFESGNLDEKAKKAADDLVRISKEVAEEAAVFGKEAAKIGKGLMKAAKAGIKAGVEEAKKTYADNK